jgi:thioredoxin reductase (NADPH)
VEFVYDTINSLELDGPVKKIIGEEGEYTCKAVIIASGGEHNKLEVPGEDEFSGRGVSYCATCDGNFFRDQDVTVVGGGDAAMDEGLYLTRMTKSVTVVHRREELRASKILQQRAFDNPKMNFVWNSAIKEIKGDGDVKSIVLENLKTGEVSEQVTDGVFVYIGFHPISEFMIGAVDLDAAGHVVTDIQMNGVAAALSAYRYISEA